MQAQFISTIDEPWLRMEPIRVGRVPPGIGTADTYVTVSDDGKPVLRIDVYGDPGEETFTFSEVLVWKKWVAVGFGHLFHLVGWRDRVALTFQLPDYFGQIHVGEGYLIVTSASRLLRLQPDGTRLWTSDEVGIDGVNVMNVNSETITGEGEWDPPGDWRPFTIDARSGKQTAI